MRLLKRSLNDGFELVTFEDKKPPPYATLSHTWGEESEEVTFDDINNGRGRHKAGFEKIKFCGEQAARDGLQYFWADTCCINKNIHSEVQTAISSMFHWYQRSVKCYVYLFDVPDTVSEVWEQEFRKSKWFKRGWTLQELLAPMSVEFFSTDFRQIGDKRSLEQQIHEITGIPRLALQGEPLSRFSVEDRIQWMQLRSTTREEDLVYSLLGVFGVSLSLRYGEGQTVAFERLQKEIEKLQKCCRDVRLIDPLYHKQDIEYKRGGLLEELHQWILEHPDFQRWRDDEQNRLLWIKGDPGKGKTMLLCGIINELQSIDKTALLSYFFCVASDSRINNATAILRGLIYMLICQQSSLVSHIRKKYDYAGKSLFDDSNAWFALSEILTDILQDPNLKRTYLIIDALDECVEADLSRLLDLINTKSSISPPHVKWIVSSRNWPSVERDLGSVTLNIRLCLELNERSVSAAIARFIQLKADWLAKRNNYSTDLKRAIQEYLSLNAKGTFLWVALVCQELSKVPGWKACQSMAAFPPGLDTLYQRMLDQIKSSEDARLCISILALASSVYRPITLDELKTLIDLPIGVFGDDEALSNIIRLCGSFLTLQKRTVTFIHQSAKDFLLKKAYDDIYPLSRESVHYSIFSRSLQAMSKLRRDIYGLSAPGVSIDQIEECDPDPLCSIRYSCVYWIHHLHDCDLISNNELQDDGSISLFLRRRYLYWLEALSLCRGVPEVVMAIGKLEAFLNRKVDVGQVLELVRDTRRFIMSHKRMIQIYPLQKEEPKGIMIRANIGQQWSPCLQTLEAHSGKVTVVVFSHDSTRLASASNDNTIQIWDASSGEYIWTLIGHSDTVTAILFSDDLIRLASISDDCTIKIWDIYNGKCLQTLKNHGHPVATILFTHNSLRLASVSYDNTIKIWDANSDKFLQILEGHTNIVTAIVFAHDSTRLASMSHDGTIKVWNTNSGECLQTLEDYDYLFTTIVFSHDSTRLASGSDDRTIKIWNVNSGECLQILKSHKEPVATGVFSHDSILLASGSDDCTVKIWNVNSGKCLQTLKGHSDTVAAVGFSHDSTQLASASYDCTIKIWDTGSDEYTQTIDDYRDAVVEIIFSHDSKRLASVSYSYVKIWDVNSYECLQILEGHKHAIIAIGFSYDSAQLASTSYDSTIKIWDTDSGTCLYTLEDNTDILKNSLATRVVFSPNSTRLASISNDKMVKIWNIQSGECLQTIKGYRGFENPVIFSHDSTRLASAQLNRIKIWDTDSGLCLHSIQAYGIYIFNLVFSYDSTRLASVSSCVSMPGKDPAVHVWDANSGECLQTLNFDEIPRNVSFDTTNSYLYTSVGTVALSTGSCSKISADNMGHQDLNHQEEIFGLDGEWITYNSERLIWLPSEYRPLCSAVSGNMIGAGTGSGEVWICSLQATDLAYK